MKICIKLNLTSVENSKFIKDENIKPTCHTTIALKKILKEFIAGKPFMLGDPYSYSLYVSSNVYNEKFHAYTLNHEFSNVLKINIQNGYLQHLEEFYNLHFESNRRNINFVRVHYLKHKNYGYYILKGIEIYTNLTKS